MKDSPLYKRFQKLTGVRIWKYISFSQCIIVFFLVVYTIFERTLFTQLQKDEKCNSILGKEFKPIDVFEEEINFEKKADNQSEEEMKYLENKKIYSDCTFEMSINDECPITFSAGNKTIVMHPPYVPVKVKILVGILSAASYYDLRTNIRETWARYHGEKNHEWRYMFLIAHKKKDCQFTNDVNSCLKLNEQVIQERCVLSFFFV